MQGTDPELPRRIRGFPGQGGGGGRCRVSFKTARLSATEIPEFAAYRDTLRQAKESWADNPSVTDYLKAIDHHAGKDQVDALYVIDNGKGFDERGLEAVLAEGTPDKQDGSSGSFGIGHLTTYGLSGLQYIFYLGKRRDGGLVSAGHAILSSFKDPEGTLCSNHGYFLRKYRPTFDSPYVYCDPGDIPPFLLREAEDIEGSGSIVAVLGFKGFREKAGDADDPNRLSKLIREAVAENFAIAICSEMLEIEVQADGGRADKIDRESIMGFLRWMARPETGTREATKEAQLTLEAIETHQEPHAKGRLPGEFGDCKLSQRNRAGTHSVSIWRNGMLITRRHGGLSRSMFDGKKPLNAIVLLSGKEDPRNAHDLVKKAETPLHDRIQEKRLPTRKEKQGLKSLLGGIRDWITEHAEDSGGESTYLDDEIMLDAGSTGAFREHAPPRSRVEDDDADDATPEEPGTGRHPREPGEDRDPSRQGRRGKRAVNRKNHTPVKVQGRLVENAYQVRLVPSHDTGSAILEIDVDTGQDPSCSGAIASRDLGVTGATLPRPGNGQGCRVDGDGRVILTGLRKGEGILVDLVFAEPLPDGVSLECRVGSREHATDAPGPADAAGEPAT